MRVIVLTLVVTFIVMGSVSGHSAKQSNELDMLDQRVGVCR